ncbi:hypothetical protein EGT07_08115 [Herbaspirillum sp. HC18]|nr:hypothetical protein EGT07_08115 [Herbaspirillum sp. HC18]
MRKWLIGVVMLACSLASHAAGRIVQPVRFDFQMVNVAQIVQLIYAEVLKEPYVIDPDVLADTRLVSFRYDSSQGDLTAFVRAFLDALGVRLESRGGIQFVAKKKPEEKKEADTESFVYRPKYRDAGYLAELLRPLFKGQFTINRTVPAPVASKQADVPAPPGSAAALVDRNADALVFSGVAAEVRQLERLLAQVDDRPGEVMVRGVVYEVGASDKDGSAFSLALNLLGGKLSVVGGTANALDNAVRFKNQTIDAVMSALSSDTRFKVVSSPSLRVRSGGSGRFSVGQDVPVLGSIMYPANGQAPVQSVEYRSSGVIFDLQPLVRDAVVDLNVLQQISSFVATETGVNGSPTLIKREVKTSLTLSDGDVVVLGGLAENKESAGRNGLSFLPAFMHSRSNESSRSEILLVLQLSRI